MNHFLQTSYFDHPQSQPVQLPLPNKPKLPFVTAAKTREIDNKTLEDWAYRLEQCAHEAEDEQLLPLNSDLLDLRDEVVHLLHQNV